MGKRINTKKGQNFIARIKTNLEDLAPYVNDGKEMLSRIRTYRAFRLAAAYMGKKVVLGFVESEIQKKYDASFLGSELNYGN